MQYFTQDFIDFFLELGKNNNKEWFHANKKRYEASIKKPFEAFLQEFITNIQEHDPSLSIEPKDCILRINRDIRFAKDKSPYNTHYTAFVSNGGRKDKSIPGIYLRFAPDMVGIMGGCYGPTGPQLANLRNTISNDSKLFRKLIEAKPFVKKFEEIKGEENKRIPKEWQEAQQQEPLIAKKQFYFVAEREPDLITSKKLLKELMDYWKAARPFNEYLTKAIQG